MSSKPKVVMGWMGLMWPAFTRLKIWSRSLVSWEVNNFWSGTSRWNEKHVIWCRETQTLKLEGPRCPS